MEQDQSKLLALREDIFTRRLNRRDVLKRATVLGLSAPVIATLLAACGDDDDDDEPTATTAPAEPTEAEEEPTEAEEEPTEAEEEPTEAEEEPTEAEEEPTEAEEEPTTEETPDGSGAEGEWEEAGDTLLGFEMEEGTPGGVIIEASISDISTTNPIFSADTASSAMHQMVFEPLFAPHPETLEVTGRLAGAWQVNEDATVWTIRLREGITWHDGEDLTADDVKFTYDTHLNTETGSPRTADFASKIESIEVVDDLTITFNLLSTLVDFPLDLGVYNIIAEHVWADVAPADMVNDGGSTGEDPSRVVGTGPFLFNEWIVDDNVSLLRNDNYWDGAPYLDEYIIKVVQDQAAGVAQLRTGEVDWGNVPEASVPELDGTDVMVSDVPTLNFTFYGTNLDPERTPLFQEAAVRKALFHAINREELIESIRFGYGEVAIGSFPTLSWAYNPSAIEHQYPYDPELAMQLLDEAGWVPGADGIREKDGMRLSFTMNTNAGNNVRESYLVAFQEYWRQIGVEMTPNLIPFPQLVEQLTTTFDFEVFLVGFNWSASPDQSAVFSCDAHGSGFNAVGYCNEEVDALLQEALNETDQERRIELYTQYQNIMLDDLPMPIIDFPRALFGTNNRVHNMIQTNVNRRFNTHHWWVES